MFSNKVDDTIVKDLETVLRDKYGFLGSLTNTKFSGKTEKAFPQLISALREQQDETSGLNVSQNVPGEDCTPKIGDSAFYCRELVTQRAELHDKMDGWQLGR
jgi:hypothetical protein